VIFDGQERETAIYQRDKVPPGYEMQGPALLEEGGSTTVVPPGWSATLDNLGCLVFTRN